MSIAGLFLGVIDIAIVAVLLILFGLFVVWILTAMQYPPPAEMRKFYLIFVLLIVLYMMVALFFGLPSFSVMRLR